jgi:hypothetical protein
VVILGCNEFPELVDESRGYLVVSGINLHNLSAHDIVSGSLWNLVIIRGEIFPINFIIRFLDEVLIFLSTLLDHIVFSIFFQL